MPTPMHTGIEELLKQIENFPFVESDGEPIDSPWHRDCMMLLITSLLNQWRARDDFYVGGNMFLYYCQEQAEKLYYKGPDFFVVNGGVRLRPERHYWVTWFENSRYPDVIIELASPSTEREDRTTKFRIYEQTFRTRNYFIYDPTTGHLDGWELNGNQRYQPLTPNEQGWLWCAELSLWVGTWEGEFSRNHATWLRFYDQDGQLVLISDEARQLLLDEEMRRADDEKQRADDEKSRADDEKRRADAAEAELTRLRALLNQSGQGNGTSVPPA